MPTGYTSEIYEGKDLSGKEFIIKCARAFGACIEMRDMGLDAEIPEEFKPNTYHLEQIEKSRMELNKYKNMDMIEVQNTIDKEYKNTMKDNKETIKKYTELKNRYQNLIAEVNAWIPPTKEHVNLKEFAIQQLTESIEWDCNISYFEKEVVKPTAKEWLNMRINGCLENIEYHSKKQQEENKRIAERNKWIKDLRNSL